ncbi:MAG: phospholipase [Acidobacteriota bacterium]
MKALCIYAGEGARRHIRNHGLQPKDVRVVPAAAGGPKGLILQPLDQHLFGHWLPQGQHEVHLIGASIGAWRMATALMDDPVEAFELFAQGYIGQQYEPEAGRKLPGAKVISEGFAQSLEGLFGPHIDRMLQHPRYRLHVLTSRGRQVLRRAGRIQTGVGMAGLALGNAVTRKAVGLFLERTVFSTPGSRVPVPLIDQPTRHVVLSADNFKPAIQASCSIPFWLDPVMDIPGAVTGAHWDGGLVDYHLHWNYAAMDHGLVLYPHFQKQVIPGWLDKTLKWRHRATPALSNMLLLAPHPQWVKTLPFGKLPDRSDFTGLETPLRIQTWTRAVSQSRQLADEWAQWLDRGCPLDEVQPI